MALTADCLPWPGEHPCAVLDSYTCRTRSYGTSHFIQVVYVYSLSALFRSDLGNRTNPYRSCTKMAFTADCSPPPGEHL